MMINALHHLGRCLSQLGRHGEAEATLCDVLARSEALGAGHPDNLLTACELAACLAAVGRSSDAESMLRHVVERQSAVLGGDHPRTIEQRARLGVLRRYLELPEQSAPLGDPRLPLYEGRFLIELKRYAEAEALPLGAERAGGDEAAGARRALLDLYTPWGKPEQAALYRPSPPEEDGG